MKFKIDYFLLTIIKQNLFYVISILVMIAAIVFSFLFFAKLQNENTQKIEELISQIVVLKNKVELIKFKGTLKEEGIDIDEVNKVFNQLVPEVEDYFTIMVALEKISQQTGFSITGYAINLKQSSQKKLSLTVSGIGDNRSFLTFLKDYNYVGGRLITIDKIEFSSTLGGGSKLTLNFYSGKEQGEKDLQKFRMTQKERSFIETVTRKTTFQLESETPQSLEYPKKARPF